MRTLRFFAFWGSRADAVLHCSGVWRLERPCCCSAAAFGWAELRKSTFDPLGTSLFMSTVLWALLSLSGGFKAFLFQAHSFEWTCSLTEDLHDLFLEEIKLGKSSGSKRCRVKGTAYLPLLVKTQKTGNVLMNYSLLIYIRGIKIWTGCFCAHLATVKIE